MTSLPDLRPKFSNGLSALRLSHQTLFLSHVASDGSSSLSDTSIYLGDCLKALICLHHELLRAILLLLMPSGSNQLSDVSISQPLAMLTGVVRAAIAIAHILLKSGRAMEDVTGASGPRQLPLPFSPGTPPAASATSRSRLAQKATDANAQQQRELLELPPNGFRMHQTAGDAIEASVLLILLYSQRLIAGRGISARAMLRRELSVELNALQALLHRLVVSRQHPSRTPYDLDEVHSRLCSFVNSLSFTQ